MAQESLWAKMPLTRQAIINKQNEIASMAQGQPSQEDINQSQPMQQFPLVFDALRAKQDEARQAQIGSIQGAEQRLAELQAKPSQFDLSPIVGLVDTWTGSNLLRGYKKPESVEDREKTINALQGAIMRARGDLTDSDIQALKNSVSAKQDESDLATRLLIAQSKIGSAAKAQEEKMAAKPSEGVKALDRDFAKDYNEWTSTGRPTLEKNLQSLEEAKQALIDDPNLVGGLTGTLPDRLTSDKVLKQRQKVNSAIQGSLRATLGSAFTEKEGERILKNAYNESASPEANIESLNRIIEELKKQRDSKNSKSDYFEAAGTLSGFSAKTPTISLEPLSAPKSAAPQKSGGGDLVKMQAPDGSIRRVPKDKVQSAIKAGGKVID